MNNKIAMSVKYQKLKIVVGGMVVWSDVHVNTCGELWYRTNDVMPSIFNFWYFILIAILFCYSTM